MIPLIFALGLSIAVEWLAFAYWWQFRKYLLLGAAFFGLFAAGGIAQWRPDILSASLLVVALYRFVNQLIVVHDRGNADFIRNRTCRSAKVFAVLAVALAFAWAASDGLAADTQLHFVAAAGALSLGVLGILLLFSTRRTILRSAWKAASVRIREKDLPTVSLAIPARNETETLERTLKAAVASDYPKLEILVLDDCSQDATADIIKAYAHDGVRFVQGGVPPGDHWVHKNYACQQLLGHASGEWVLFAGVDVAMEPQTISQLIAYATEHSLQMVSVLPMRANESGPALFQTIRYWWEMALPRQALRRPPVLSSCWLAKAEAVRKLGSFEAASRKIVPEAFFAREFDSKHAYRFVLGAALGVSSRKTAAEQFATALRVRYPQVRRKPEVVMAYALAWLYVFGVPLFSLVWRDTLVNPIVIAVWLLGWLLVSVSYVLIQNCYTSSGGFITAICAPFLPLVDVILLHISLYQYEFGTIEWKGRNICMPVMHVYKSLPPLPELPEDVKQELGVRLTGPAARRTPVAKRAKKT